MDDDSIYYAALLMNQRRMTIFMRYVRVYISYPIRARAHWPLCLATGGRVFVAYPSTLGRYVAATAKFPTRQQSFHNQQSFLPY